MFRTGIWKTQGAGARQVAAYTAGCGSATRMVRQGAAARFPRHRGRLSTDAVHVARDISRVELDLIAGTLDPVRAPPEPLTDTRGGPKPNNQVVSRNVAEHLVQVTRSRPGSATLALGPRRLNIEIPAV